MPYIPPSGDDVNFIFTEEDYTPPDGDNTNFLFGGEDMSEQVVTVINPSGTVAVEIEDLGIILPASGSEDLHEQFDIDEIVGSRDLKTLVAAGTLQIDDGSGVMSAADATLYITLVNKKFLKDTHYTKTNLQTTGEAQVHWDNITNRPSMIDPSWASTPAVLYRVLALNLADASSLTPNEGDIYGNLDGKFYQFNGLTWVEKKTITDGDLVIDLSDAEESVKEYKLLPTPGFVDIDGPFDNRLIIVNDDGDLGSVISAQYQYSVEAGNKWVFFARIDFTGHFDGGPGKHDASEINTENDYAAIGSLAGDGLESVLSDINDAISGLGGGTSGTPQMVENGILYIWDGAKWISATRQTLIFGRNGASRKQYLAFGAGVLASNRSGFLTGKSMVITRVSTKLDAAGTCDIQIRKNDVASAIITQTLTSVDRLSTDVSVNLAATDFLQAYVDGATRVDSPVVIVEVAYLSNAASPA
jgi:hypothetical protein